MEKKLGLTQKEAESRLNKSGLNILPETPPTKDVVIFIRQLQSPLIYILIGATLISLLLRDTVDALFIMVAITVNTVLGFYQERKAEKGLSALKQILSPKAKVIRDKEQQELEAKYLVPGDLVVITAGDKVPADGYLVEAHDLLVNESILTGESEAVGKEASRNKHEELPEQDKEINKNQMVFMGTTVAGGVGKFIVTHTGLNTEIGKIATSLEKTSEDPTPLQKRLNGLSRTLTWLVIGSATFILFTGMIRGESFVEMFTTSVAVAVAAIPEGLVIALTAILALGMQRILKRKALVRKLVVAETLGTVTVIATDKTGTLTEGRLRVVKTEFLDRKKGLQAATLANQMLDPLEVALWEWLTAQPNFDPEKLMSENIRSHMHPFDAVYKLSACRYDQKLFIIGAPEALLERSSLNQKDKQRYYQMFEQWAREGLRILSIGEKPVKSQTITIEQIKGIEFLGLIGFADPVRTGVRQALDLCKEAGIAVKVVTGDFRLTAETVMKKCGLKISHPEKEIIEGEELAHLDEKELLERVKNVKLFARVAPNQKLAIVAALQKNGEVVALLGDGVNDAPAIKKADIGIVVGSASDVARETADLVLLDSNFATIVAAVEEGRGIFANIQKVLTYILSDTFAEVTLIFLGLIFGVPLPLTAAQILWINLVTDTFPTLALTLEPKEKNLLKQQPIAADLPILGKSILALMLIASFSAGIIVFGLYYWLFKTTGNVELARLVAFTAFGIKSLFYVFSLRERHKLFIHARHFANKWLWMGVGVSFLFQITALVGGPLTRLLGTRMLNFFEWGLVLGTSLLIMGCIEAGKIARKIWFT